VVRKYDQPADLSAYQAISEAQKIAFSAMSFQAVVCLLRLGILQRVADAGEDGASACGLAEALGISEYGVKVLLDMGLTMNLVWMNEDRYALDKVGHFLLEDRMTQVNVNFAQDVCYEAMNQLMASISNGKPEGLKVFGDWPTIYPGLSQLPSPAKESWFAFDHFYSGAAFPHALAHVFESQPAHIFDVGGNTGVWANHCVEHDANVRVTIVDLPEQTALARENVQRNSAHADRIDTYDIDVLDPQQSLPAGADAIWMSQFIDCFSEAEIAEILGKAVAVMDEESSLFIMEAFWDRQPDHAGAYSLNATSLYFACIANGNSRMYGAQDIIGIAEKSGLHIAAQHDGLGIGHTLLHCRKAP
jgi:Dimerisation2-like domain/O-methyltransferase domain